MILADTPPLAAALKLHHRIDRKKLLRESVVSATQTPFHAKRLDDLGLFLQTQNDRLSSLDADLQIACSTK